MDKFFLAAVFGPLLIILGLMRLFCVKQNKELDESVKNSAGLIYLGSVINLLLGLVIVNVYNEWLWNLGLLVTVLGWLMIIRAILLLLFPQKMFHMFIEHRIFNAIASIIGIIWGVLLVIYAHY